VHKCYRRPIIDLRFSPWRKSSLLKQCLQQEHCQTQPIKARPWIFTLKDRTLNFSCAVAPTYKSLFEVTKHQASSTSPPSSDHHCSSTNLGFHDLLRQLHGKKMSSMIVTASRASKCSLWNQTVR
jgi:hypothetical protein